MAETFVLHILLFGLWPNIFLVLEKNFSAILIDCIGPSTSVFLDNLILDKRVLDRYIE